MIDFGTVRPGTTLYVPFHTFDSNDPSASVTITGLATTDIEIYKDGSVTQRASDTGYALLDTDGIDFDGVTGIHGFSIDLSSNATAGFYAAGSQYWVVVSSVTIDAATVNFVAATFRIGYADALYNTTIATLATQTSFTLTTGPAEDDALNGCVVCIHDVASAVQMGFAVVSDYTGSTKTVTLTAGTTFTAVATDNIAIYPPGNSKWFAALATVALPLTPTVAGRALDVSAGGEAGLDWANVGSPTTTVGLSGTTVATATNLTNAPTNGDLTATMKTSVTTAATAATPTAAAVTGAVGSVTGSVGSVVGLTASNLDATVSSRMATTHIAATAGVVDRVTLVDTTTANTDMRGTDSAYTGTPPTAADNADAVWEEAIIDHSGTAGSTAEQLAAAGAAGDPWATALPGAYGAGTAGKIVGDNVDAAISTRATPAEILTTALTESYAANGVAPTLVEVMFAVHQMLMQFAISGTSYTVRKLDNSTTAFVVTLDDATSPTSAVRT